MSKAVKIIFGISLIVWILSCNVYRYIGGDLLYFIGNAIFIQLLSIALHLQFRTNLTLIFVLLACNNLIDEVTLTATIFKSKEYLYFGIVVLYLLLKKRIKCRRR